MLYSKLGRPALGKTKNLVGLAPAEEIVQETFVKLWQKKMVFPNLKSAYAWVYKCCTNAAIDYLRNHNQSANVALDETEASSQNLENQAVAGQAWRHLARELSKDEAALFIYRNLEGLSQDEAAEVMQISRRTVNRLQEKLELKLEKMRRRERVG
ncbi:MAG: RNA polymerase sigma factor [Bdellovibrionia bacterium]